MSLYESVKSISYVKAHASEVLNGVIDGRRDIQTILQRRLLR
jgi:hypothetical protein